MKCCTLCQLMVQGHMNKYQSKPSLPWLWFLCLHHFIPNHCTSKNQIKENKQLYFSSWILWDAHEKKQPEWIAIVRIAWREFSSSRGITYSLCFWPWTCGVLCIWEIMRILRAFVLTTLNLSLLIVLMIWKVKNCQAVIPWQSLK